ncbi:hypothetical protein [Clostridium tetani]|uniref:Uncharacterized protein n=1 Tax=Clostridium tetani TaxID=1513 RepID=A0ABC8EHN8_CLOTA|nr:hypothetical protein [Clostridium tetani]BDR82539.1 hypothetical protein K234311028_p20220 [Clostridium tetani]
MLLGLVLAILFIWGVLTIASFVVGIPLAIVKGKQEAEEATKKKEREELEEEFMRKSLEKMSKE